VAAAAREPDDFRLRLTGFCVAIGAVICDLGAVKNQVTRYAIVIEKTQSGFSAHVPDLPSCWAEGPTLGLVQHTIRQVVGAHFASLRARGLEIPAPSSQVAYLEVPARIL
jgi:predicted RNase H-like HicB family nuclease